MQNDWERLSSDVVSGLQSIYLKDAPHGRLRCGATLSQHCLVVRSDLVFSFPNLFHRTIQRWGVQRGRRPGFCRIFGIFIRKCLLVRLTLFDVELKHSHWRFCIPEIHLWVGIHPPSQIFLKGTGGNRHHAKDKVNIVLRKVSLRRNGARCSPRPRVQDFSTQYVGVMPLRNGRMAFEPQEILSDKLGTMLGSRNTSIFKSRL